MTLKAVLIFFLFLALSHCHAGAKQPARLLTGFPFLKYQGSIVLVQVQLDDYRDTLCFILDTGNSGISLDSATCERLQIANRLTDTFVSGVGGRKRVRFAFGRRLKIGGIDAGAFDFHIVDYSVMSHIDERKIDGVIGYSFLKHFILTVDYAASVIHMYTPGAFTYPDNAYVFNAATGKFPVPVQQARVSDKLDAEGRFYFDLGARMELILSRQALEKTKILSGKRPVCFLGVEGVSGREQMQVTVVKKLEIGPYTFRNVPAYVYDDPDNVIRYPQQLGLVGSGLYNRFDLVLNLPAGEIAMKPNKDFNSPFDYAYSGLNIYSDSGRFTVYDVAPGSPAEKAGIREGDEVLMVDNIAYDNVQSCRNAISKTNAMVVLLLKRNNSQFYCIMQTKSIL